MKPGDVRLPKSDLETDLGRIAALKREAQMLLRSLEEGYAKSPITKPGGWRQDPVAWMKRYRA